MLNPQKIIFKELENIGIATDNLNFRMKGLSIILEGSVENNFQYNKLEKIISKFSSIITIEYNVSIAKEEEEEEEEYYEEEEEDIADYTEYEIEVGDTLESIAEWFYEDKNQAYIIDDYNELNGRLKTGKTIYLPTLQAYVGSLKLQFILYYLGYEVGNLDSIIGSRTKAAIKEFQENCDLNITGIVDDETAEYLRAAFSENAEEFDDLDIQIILDYLGYNIGELDGIWGKKSDKALLQFQADYDLEQTGEIDDDTFATLVAAFV